APERCLLGQLKTIPLVITSKRSFQDFLSLSVRYALLFVFRFDCFSFSSRMLGPISSSRTLLPRRHLLDGNFTVERSGRSCPSPFGRQAEHARSVGAYRRRDPAHIFPTVLVVATMPRGLPVGCAR